MPDSGWWKGEGTVVKCRRPLGFSLRKASHNSVPVAFVALQLEMTSSARYFCFSKEARNLQFLKNSNCLIVSTITDSIQISPVGSFFKKLFIQITIPDKVPCTTVLWSFISSQIFVPLFYPCYHYKKIMEETVWPIVTHNLKFDDCVTWS